MIITDDIKNRFEDAFIWFEDEKYEYRLSSSYDCQQTQQAANDLYGLVKVLGKDNELSISTSITLTLSKKNYQGKDVKTYQEWQEYNTNLATALRRLGYSTEKITIDDMKEYVIYITLYGKSFIMKNCNKLTSLCTSFNKNLLWNNLLSAKPFYNPNTNEVEVYIVGSGGKKGEFSCFDLFEECLEVKYRDERKDFTHNDVPAYTITKVRERVGIKEFFTIKQTYFEWSDEEDDYVMDSENVDKNPYLSNINGFVIAKVKPINFDI